MKRTIQNLILSLKSLTARQRLGIAGAILLAAGIFLPAAKVPFAGTLTLIKVSEKEGTLLLLLAIAAFIFSVLRIYKALGPMAILAVILFGLTYHNAKSQLLGDSSGRGHTLLKGLQTAVMKRVDFQWGLWVCLAGVVFLILAAIPGKSSRISASGSESTSSRIR